MELVQFDLCLLFADELKQPVKKHIRIDSCFFSTCFLSRNFIALRIIGVGVTFAQKSRCPVSGVRPSIEVPAFLRVLSDWVKVLRLHFPSKS